MLRFTGLLDVKMLLWVVPALVIPLLAIAASCSGEPEVVVIDRTVVVIKEVEVVVEKEVVVTATPSPIEATPPPTRDAQATGTPTSTTPARDKSVLFIRNWDTEHFSQLGSLGFSEGISVKIVAGKTGWINETGRPSEDISFNDYRGILIVGEPSSILLDEVRTFVSTGGKAAFLINACKAYDADIEYLQEELQFAFGVSCAETTVPYPMRGRGEQFLPLWDGLVLNNPHDTRVEFTPGPSGDFKCVGKVQTEIGTLCAALYGTVGSGAVIFVANTEASRVSTIADKHIHLRDNRIAASRLLNWLVEETGGSRTPGSSFDAASVLARFSTHDPTKGEVRADAVAEIIAQHRAGNVDTGRVLDLLHTTAPEMSIAERRIAASELAGISADGQWDENDTERGIFQLATLITGEEVNAAERIEAAHEMVVLYEAGELDADHGLDLMNTIAPGLGVNERWQAAATLARLAADGDWDDADRMEAASEVFRLVTGVPLNAEERMGAAVDLAGVGAKVFDEDDSLDDRDIDNATAIIKQALTGDLTSQSLQNILESGN